MALVAVKLTSSNATASASKNTHLHPPTGTVYDEVLAAAESERADNLMID